MGLSQIVRQLEAGGVVAGCAARARSALTPKMSAMKLRYRMPVI